MSRIYDQVKEITEFFIDDDAKDVDTLYEKLILNNERKSTCFVERKFDERKMQVRLEDISREKFKRIIQLMSRLNILKTKPLKLTEANEKALRNYDERLLNSLLGEILKGYFEEHGITISGLKDKVIDKIKYPELRNATTIHKNAKLWFKPKKMIGIQDFSKLLTLLSDIDVLERKSPTLFF